jgi:hypothetical protein
MSGAKALAGQKESPSHAESHELQGGQPLAPGPVPSPEETFESDSDDDNSSFHDALSEATTTPVSSPSDFSSSQAERSSSNFEIDSEVRAEKQGCDGLSLNREPLAAVTKDEAVASFNVTYCAINEDLPMQKSATEDSTCLRSREAKAESSLAEFELLAPAVEMARPGIAGDSDVASSVGPSHLNLEDGTAETDRSVRDTTTETVRVNEEPLKPEVHRCKVAIDDEVIEQVTDVPRLSECDAEKAADVVDEGAAMTEQSLSVSESNAEMSAANVESLANTPSSDIKSIELTTECATDFTQSVDKESVLANEITKDGSGSSEADASLSPEFITLKQHLTAVSANSDGATWRDSVTAMDAVAVAVLSEEAYCVDTFGCERDYVLKLLVASKEEMCRALTGRIFEIRPSLVTSAYLLLKALFDMHVLVPADLKSSVFPHSLEAAASSSKSSTCAAKCVVSMAAAYPADYISKLVGPRESARFRAVCAKVCGCEPRDEKTIAVTQQALAALDEQERDAISTSVAETNGKEVRVLQSEAKNEESAGASVREADRSFEPRTGAESWTELSKTISHAVSLDGKVDAVVDANDTNALASETTAIASDGEIEAKTPEQVAYAILQPDADVELQPKACDSTGGAVIAELPFAGTVKSEPASGPLASLDEETADNALLEKAQISEKDASLDPTTPATAPMSLGNPSESPQTTASPQPASLDFRLSARKITPLSIRKRRLYTEDELDEARRVALRQAIEEAKAMFEDERVQFRKRLSLEEAERKGLQDALNQYEATIGEMVARDNSNTSAVHAALESERNSLKADLLERKSHGAINCDTVC